MPLNDCRISFRKETEQKQNEMEKKLILFSSIISHNNLYDLNCMFSINTVRARVSCKKTHSEIIQRKKMKHIKVFIFFLQLLPLSLFLFDRNADYFIFDGLLLCFANISNQNYQRKKYLYGHTYVALTD